MRRDQAQRGTVRALTLAGVSLGILIQALPFRPIAISAAQAQDATPPRPRARNPADQTAQAGVVLEELSVTGQGGGGRRQEDPLGPIDGFVPTRSLTATKTNTPLIETPQSITVIGRQQLDAQRALTVPEALKYVPGVYGGTYGPGSRIDFYLIRGFTAQDTGLYLNGLQLLQYGNGTFQVDPFGLERIEVLRGPAAVLFGQGGPGGLVNLISKRPPLEELRYVEAGGGSYGQKYLAFDVGGPADAEGHWFYRLTALGRNGGTQLDGTDDNRGYIAPSFTYKPDGATTFTVLTSFQHDETGRIGGFLPYVGTVRPQALGLRIPLNVNINDPQANRFRRTQAYGGYQFEHVFDEVFTFRQNLRYSFTESYDNTLISGSYVAGTNQTVLNRYRSQSAGRENLFNVDNQLEAHFDTGLFRHTMLFGLDYKQAQLDGTSARSSTTANLPALRINFLAPVYGVPTPIPTPFNVTGTSFQQLGIYAQDQIHITPELSIIASGRGDFTENDVLNKLTSRTTEQRANAATQRYGIVYDFDFGLAPYLSYATFFNPVIGTDFFSQPFKPETGDQYEAGVKYQPPGSQLLATAAVFDLIRTNVSTTDPTNINNTIQIGAVRSRGVELGLQANVTPDFNVTASFTSYDLRTVADGSAARIGKTPVNTPQTLASAFADYTIPTGPLAGFGFGGGVRYIGMSYASVDNYFTVPEVVLFDAQVHYVRDGWRFAINATNVADRHYVASCISTGSGCYYGDARRVIASASYKW
ncbi:TonB-dependent siderophore receptor [Methylobacterium sp. WL2]|nr:TonB-dependent siderophore receptor [Methylobacterium sp. WL1]TXN57413.1 TonB-dependent siderophore receptor [Methylobacterium sp. WL2]